MSTGSSGNDFVASRLTGWLHQQGDFGFAIRVLIMMCGRMAGGSWHVLRFR